MKLYRVYKHNNIDYDIIRLTDDQLDNIINIPDLEDYNGDYIEIWPNIENINEEQKNIEILDEEEKNIEILGNDVRPIFSTCYKALNDDDREVVLSCLDNLENIILSYLDKRKNYRGQEDEFLLFLNGQFEITLNIALRSYNQQYFEDINERVGLIGLKCVELSDTQIRIGENGLVFPWIEFLKSSIFKIIDFKYTSAPSKAIKSIYEIGIKLIEKNAFTTSINTVGDSLQKIGEYVSSKRGSYYAFLTQDCISGLTKMLKSFLGNITKRKNMIEGTEVKSLCAIIVSK
jgi:hypothetical protein